METSFRELLARVRREAAQVRQECLDDDGTLYRLTSCAAMVVRSIREERRHVA